MLTLKVYYSKNIGHYIWYDW